MYTLFIWTGLDYEYYGTCKYKDDVDFFCNHPKLDIAYIAH